MAGASIQCTVEIRVLFALVVRVTWGDQQNQKYINTNTTSALTLTFNAQLLEYETWHVDPADQGKLSEKKAYTTNALSLSLSVLQHTLDTHSRTQHTHRLQSAGSPPRRT